MAEQAPSRLISWVFSPLSRFVPDWFGALFLGVPMADRVVFDEESSLAVTPRQTRLPTQLLTQAGQGTNPGKSSRLVDAVVPQSLFLKRKVTAPLGAAKSLTSVARLDLQRKTPLQLQNICWILGDRQKSPSTLTADQWVVKKSDLERWNARLGKAGLKVRKYSVAGAEEFGPIADFTTQVSPNARRWRTLNGALLLLTVCFGFAWWLYPAWALGAQIDDLEGRIQTLQAEALELRPEIEQRRVDDTEKAAFLDAINRRAVLSEALRELTIALPDTVWLDTLSFRSDRVVIGGETQGSAPELVLDLSKNIHFRNPRLSGPVSKTTTGAERFEITLNQVAGP